MTNNSLSFQTGFGDGTGALKLCFFAILPTVADMDTMCNEAATEVNGTNFVALIRPPAGPPAEYCLYQYDVDTTVTADVRTNAALVTSLAPANPAAVPIFTPLGILAMVSGLLWFGKRRRKVK